VANFAEVFLARDGHVHPDGGQLREEAPDVAAGVDYVRAGRADPAPLDDFAEGLRGHLPVDVAGEGEPALTARFDGLGTRPTLRVSALAQSSYEQIRRSLVPRGSPFPWV